MIKFNDLLPDELSHQVVEEIQDPEHDAIAIIGMCTKFPFANDYREFRSNIINGKDCVSEFPEVRKKDIEKYLNYINRNKDVFEFSKGGYLTEIDKFDYPFFKLSPLEAQSMDPSQRIFMETTIGAIEDAGYSPKSICETNTGIYVGYGVDSGYRQFLNDVAPESVSIAIPGNLRSMIPRRISYLLNLRGPAVVIDTACSSSLVAVHYACQALKSGECDMAIAGSVKFNLIPQFSSEKYGVQSSDGYTRSFDDSSTGFGDGEGVVSIILKPFIKAIKDNDHIYSVIKGSAINQDGTSIGITAPNPGAQEEVLIKAWNDAEIAPESISYIETHGTGTELGDPIEIDALKNAFSRFTEKKQFCAIGSVKTNIGHLDHASGITGLVKAALLLKERKLPPLLHFKKPNRKIVFTNSALYINDIPRDWDCGEEKRICGVSSFGFSGTNCHIIMEEPPKREKRVKLKNELNIFCLSAKTMSSINTLLKHYQKYLQNIEDDNLEDICYTLSQGREHYAYRLAVIVKDIEDLKEKITNLNELSKEEICSEYIFYSGEIKNHVNTYHNINDKLKEMTPIKKNKFEFIQELCKAYISGKVISWNLIYDDTNKKVSLPVYAFDPIRCWPDYEKNQKPDLIWKRNNTNEKDEEETDLVQKTPEEKIIQVWKRILGAKQVSVEDNFEAFGGNSLLAIKMETELEKKGIKLSSSEILKNGSLGRILKFYAGVSNSDSETKQLNSIDEENTEYGKNAIFIQGIEPFNEIFYKNCFYNSVFPIIKYYKKSIFPLLINDVVIYNKEDTTEGAMSLNASYLPVMSLDELLKCESFRLESVMKSKDIISELKAGINTNCPVIVWVDAFYEPLREDTYKKIHRDHTLLVYGYDDEQRIFHIIEHEHMDDLDYAKREISYDDMQRCYNGFLENYWNNANEPTVYKNFHNVNCEAESKNIKQDYIQMLKHNLSSQRDSIMTGIKYLKEFRNCFQKEFLMKDNLDKNIEDNILKLNNIINVKRVQMYVFQALFDDTFEGMKLLEGIIDHWSKIRGVVVRYYYTQRYKLSVFQDLIESVDRIIELEEKINNLFYDQLSF